MLGWSQRELGRRAGVAQSHISDIENQRLTDLTFASAAKVLAAMGARLVVGVDAPFLADRQRQRDPAHARCVTAVSRRLMRAGWTVATEVEIGSDRSRGWIDVLAYHAETGVTLVIEVKTEIHDLGQIERTLGWYEREAWAAARRRAWHPKRVIGCLLLLMSDANDHRLAQNGAAIRIGFPVRARVLNDVVDAPATTVVTGRGLAMIDPGSRRSAWLRPTRLDGRRSAARYRDYADFVGRSSGRP